MVRVAASVFLADQVAPTERRHRFRPCLKLGVVLFGRKDVCEKEPVATDRFKVACSATSDGAITLLRSHRPKYW